MSWRFEEIWIKTKEMIAPRMVFYTLSDMKMLCFIFIFLFLWWELLVMCFFIWRKRRRKKDEIPSLWILCYHRNFLSVDFKRCWEEVWVMLIIRWWILMGNICVYMWRYDVNWNLNKLIMILVEIVLSIRHF